MSNSDLFILFVCFMYTPGFVVFFLFLVDVAYDALGDFERMHGSSPNIPSVVALWALVLVLSFLWPLSIIALSIVALRK